MRQCLQDAALRDAVTHVLRRHLDGATHQAWIIGSEARGTARPGADIDIALRGTGPVDLACLSAIRSDLDGLATLRSFDVVDLSRATGRFRDEALDGAVSLRLEDGGREHVQG